MQAAVLAINAGSSTIKFGLYEVGAKNEPELAARGLIDFGDEPRLTAWSGAGAELRNERLGSKVDEKAAFAGLLEWLEGELDGGELVAAGHRVVHGASRFAGPVLLSPETIDAIDKLTPLAPLHQPRNLVPIRVLSSLRPGLPQIACFDTAFHRTIEPTVARIALPREYEAEGVRRFGFHGLSYEYIAGELPRLSPQMAEGRTVVAHLGNGCSLCAMKAGRSVDTTMGFTALDGLVMGTRPGSIDAGVLLFLLIERRMPAEELRDLLYHRSGLLGVSGISKDMRTLLSSSDPRAREAVELFTFRAAREIAAMANTLSGLDGLVFTAGIGEHSAPVRAAICARLDWLGVKLDAAANGDDTPVISAADSAVEVRIVPTNEELVIARQAVSKVRT